MADKKENSRNRKKQKVSVSEEEKEVVSKERQLDEGEKMVVVREGEKSIYLFPLPFTFHGRPSQRASGFYNVSKLLETEVAEVNLDSEGFSRFDS